MIATRPYGLEVNIGSGNGLVPSANVDPDLCRQMASPGLSELRQEFYRKILSTIPNLHTNCHLKHRPKSGPSYRRQVVHPQSWQSQMPHGEKVAKPGTLLLIILS